MSRTNAIFDRAKLEWYNTQYLQKPPVEELLPYVEEESEMRVVFSERPSGGNRANVCGSHTPLTLSVHALVCSQISPVWARAFFTDDFEYDQEARDKFWKDEKVPALLAKLTDALAALADWNHDACDAALRGVAAAEGVKAGLLINATRVAIVGRAVAPPLFDTMVVLGKERVAARLQRALKKRSAR